MKDISIIILSYNTKDVTKSCVESLFKSLAGSKKISAEVIVIDNNSSDGSIEMLQELGGRTRPGNIDLKLVYNKDNVGFCKGNNQGVKLAEGNYILFLNSDVIIDHTDFSKIIDYLDSHTDIGVLTVKVMLNDHEIDPASHRGFPTLWNSFTYFLKLEKVFGSVPILDRIFGGYHLTHLNLNSIHEIDSPTGAFFLTRKKILQELGGFDETFFMYGEDLDLSYRIKQAGYKVIYHPEYRVTHLKYSSGLHKKDSSIKKKTRGHFYEAMKIFYRKHYAKRYPSLINAIVYFLIDTKNKLT